MAADLRPGRSATSADADPRRSSGGLVGVDRRCCSRPSTSRSSSWSCSPGTGCCGPTRRAWKLFILASSFFFYGYWRWRLRRSLLLGIDRRQLGVRPGRSSGRSAPDGDRTDRSRVAGRAPRSSSTSACSATSSTPSSSSTSVTDRLERARLRTSTRRSLNVILPDRHLVLHVPGHQLRDRHRPRRVAQAGAAARLRGLPVVLRPPGRRADRAGQRVRPAARATGPTPATSSRPRRSC